VYLSATFLCTFLWDARLACQQSLVLFAVMASDEVILVLTIVFSF
jgi:hypothetical protein